MERLWFQKRVTYLAAAIMCAGLYTACQHTSPTAQDTTAAGDFYTRTPAGSPEENTWNDYGGTRTPDRMGEKFSGLKQINRENVKNLKQLWVYHTGERNELGPKSLEVTPIHHNGKLYGCSIFNKMFALNGDDGTVVWEFDPKVRRSDKVWAYKCRGVALWVDPQNKSGQCSTRVISNTIDGRVIALDAESGKPCEGFVNHIDGQPVQGGPAGSVAAWMNVMSPAVRPEERLPNIMNNQAPYPARDEFYMTSAPLIYQDLIIVGGGIADNGRVHATSGAVQAFDVRTGKLMWLWDNAPEGSARPDAERGQIATYGTPNVWAPMSADLSRGLIFLPTGSASPDYYAALRDGKDQYASSILALRLSSGGRDGGKPLSAPKLEWQFKTVIQDKWDYDAPAQPVLTELNVKGKKVPVLIQATKMGFVFILNRETGQPVFPTKNGVIAGKYADLLQGVTDFGVVPQEIRIREKSDFVTETSDGKVKYELKMKNGSHSMFQPFPPPEWQLHDTPTNKDDLLGDLARIKAVSKDCRAQTDKYDYKGMYTPPTETGSIGFPGAVGGVDWGGVTVDPINQILYVNQNRIATIGKMIPRTEYLALLAKVDNKAPKAFKEAYFDMEGTPYGLHRFPYMDSLTKLPCSDPPYGVLKAISLKDGKLLWKHNFGSFLRMSKFSAEDAAAHKAQAGEIASKPDQTLLQKAGGAAKKGLGIAIVTGHSLAGAGVPNFGGSLATQGGLLFIAAGADSVFHIYDAQSGDELHKIDLSKVQGAGSGAATPMTYLNSKNKQMIVLASGGNKFIPGKQGDAIIGFGLDDEKKKK